MYRRIMENCPSSNLPGYGPALLIKRPVRTRMQGVVGGGWGRKPPATRLAFILIVFKSLLSYFVGLPKRLQLAVLL